MSRHLRVPALIAIASLLLSLLPCVAANATPTPQLSLVAAAASLTIDRYPGEQLVPDFGIRIVAGDKPFEIHTTRRSYHDPIVAAQIMRPGRARTLPAGVVDGFHGLRDFLHVTVTNAAGRKVVDRDQLFCPNDGRAVRARPNAPPTSPYPRSCYARNPFTLGWVWGIQAGWAVNTATEDVAAPLDLADGTYTVRVHVNTLYRQLFGIPATQAAVTVKVTIRTRTDGGAAALAAPRTTAPSTQVSSPQAQAPRPAPRPTGRARMPARVRPDLRPLPAWGIAVIGPEEAGVPATGPQQYLAFNANIWNAGPSPLVVDGFRRPGTLLMDAYQYFFDTSGRQVGWAPTGTLQYDQRDGHQHWHFTDFARYRLLKANKQQAVRSHKEAFCLAPTDGIDLTVRGANWNPYLTDLGSACGNAAAIAIRETLDTGWGDTYTQYLPGQSFDITNLPNATYYIEVVANPDHRLHERTTSNNLSLRKVILGGTRGNRTVTVPPYEDINVP